MISVCVATYNGEKYIAQQLRSILSEIGDEDEVIVSDDGSRDATLPIIASLKDKRIKIYHNERHGFKWNFQNAMNHAAGDVIFLSDQDDMWLKGKKDRCLKMLEEYDLVVHNSKLADENLKVYCESFFSFYHSGKGILKNALNNTYFGACMAFKRSIMEVALPLPETNEIGHDIWLGLVAEMTGRVSFLAEPLIIYRRHEGAQTNLKQSLLHRSKRSFWVKVWSRVIVLKEVMKFYIRIIIKYLIIFFQNSKSENNLISTNFSCKKILGLFPNSFILYKFVAIINIKFMLSKSSSTKLKLLLFLSPFSSFCIKLTQSFNALAILLKLNSLIKIFPFILKLFISCNKFFLFFLSVKNSSVFLLYILSLSL